MSNEMTPERVEFRKKVRAVLDDLGRDACTKTAGIVRLCEIIVGQDDDSETADDA